jgi:hypothetical protein
MLREHPYPHPEIAHVAILHFSEVVSASARRVIRADSRTVV